MRELDELISRITIINSDQYLSYQERKDKLKELKLTYEEMESILMSACEVWTSIKELEIDVQY